MTNASKAILTLGLVAVGVGATAAAIYLVDVEQTQEARLPDVKVEVEGGQAPDFKVKTGDVDVTEEKVQVKVPEVDVKMKETEVTVPSITVTPPAQTAKQSDGKTANN